MAIDVILVDEKDQQVGVAEKMYAHRQGLLHRAFSGFVFNSRGELLLQRRDKNKYHNGGKWSNTVCSHPLPNETTKDAVERRIMEEMGFSCSFEPVGHYHYKCSFDNGLTENEYDHIFIGLYNGEVHPNPEEVMDYRWIGRQALTTEIAKNPDDFTFWLKKILELDFLNKYYPL